MKIDILTIFPQLFGTFLAESFVGIACERGALEASSHDLRDWTADRHRKVDDSPYGGGPGMVMTPEPLVEAIEALAGPAGPARTAHVVFFSPQGAPLDQAGLDRLAGYRHLVLVCGRYEGVDERIRTGLCDDEVSLGDFVLAGGELAALAIMEAVARLRPGVLGNEASPDDESFADGLLEYPHYTRPADFRGMEVPEVLRSGDHGRVARWRRAGALVRTLALRPDLIERRGGFTNDDRALLEEFGLDGD